MIIIFDRKQDFFDLALKYEMLYFLLSDFRDNWCAPPPGVAPMLWFNVLSEIFATSYELRIAAQTVFLNLLSSPVAPDGQKVNGYPTLRSILQHIYRQTSSGNSSSREVMLRLSQRIGSLVMVAGEAVASSTEPDWKKLNGSSWCLSLAGLSSTIQSLFITVYFAKVLLYRICNNLRSRKLETLIVLDEASIIFPKSATKKTSILLDYFQQARAFGIGVIFASQSMNLSDEVFANTALKVCVGGFGHGSDYESFGSAVGLNRSQREHMRTVSSPGAAVVKDIRHPFPFTVQIDKPDEFIENVSIEEILRLSKRSQSELYGEELNTTDQTASGVHQSENNSTGLDQNQLSDQLSTIPVSRSKPLTNALAMIKVQSEQPLPFLFRNETALLSDVKGGATLQKAEQAAIGQRLIIKHTLPRAKTNICYWEITSKGYEQLGVEQPIWSSKGGYQHKFCAHRISHRYQKLGYKTKIENNLSNGKLVDLVLTKDNQIIFVEICASLPLSKELVNIRKDLESELIPSELLLAVTDRKMKKPLIDLVSGSEFSDMGKPLIRVLLAGDLIELLEVPK